MRATPVTAAVGPSTARTAAPVRSRPSPSSSPSRSPSARVTSASSGAVGALPDATRTSCRCSGSRGSAVVTIVRTMRSPRSSRTSLATGCGTSRVPAGTRAAASTRAASRSGSAPAGGR